jgi:hypothetical protein
MSSAEPESSSTEGAAEVPAAAEPRPAASSRPKKKLKSKSKPRIPRTEEEIDSPSTQTLGMLGVLAILTLVMWAFARGGCNYHPPKESREPRKVELVDLARDPKDAALEFQHRMATKSFGGALDLAKGPLVDELKRQQTACDADPQCAQDASKLRGRAQTTSVLLERDPFRATARVTTFAAGAEPQRYILRLERDGQIWKAVARDVDDGNFKPRPAAIMPPPNIQLSVPSAAGTVPSPQASAAAP